MKRKVPRSNLSLDCMAPRNAGSRWDEISLTFAGVHLKKIFASLAMMVALPLLAAGQGHDLMRVRHVTDLAGHTHQLGETRGTKTVVLVFLGPECPISQRYVPELNRIALAHTNGVEFFGVISAPSISRTQAAEFAKDYALKFPVLFDDAGQLARWMRPTHVPEAFVMKPDGDLLYHGRINDGFAAPGRPRSILQHHELRDAISAVLAGTSPRRSFAQPVGCYFEDWPGMK